MTDRAVRFAARMIAVGLLGVAWAIGTLALVMIRLIPMAEKDWRSETLGYLGLLPVAVILLYVIVSDLADWHISRRSAGVGADDDPEQE